MDSETPSQVLQAVVTVQRTTRTLDHVQPLSEFNLVTTLVELENSQVLYTMAIPTPDIPVKIGAQGQTGLACLGRMLKETFQEIHQHKMTTNGIQTQQRSQSLSPMKVQRMETQRSKQMTPLQLKKHTTTALLLVSFQSECMVKHTVEQQVSNLTSKIYHNVQTVSKVPLHEIALPTQSAQQVLVDKSTNSHQELVAQVQWLFSSKQWSTSPQTTLVKSTCRF